MHTRSIAALGVLAAGFTLGLVSTAAAQGSRTDAFAVSERPSAGILLGVQGNGNASSGGGGGGVVGLTADTPVVFGVRLRVDDSRTSWSSSNRDGYGVVSLRDRVALTTVRVSLLRVRHPAERLATYVGAGLGGYRYDFASPGPTRLWRAGYHALGGVEMLDESGHIAVDLDVSIAAANGPQRPPLWATAVFQASAGIGVKLRL